MRLTKQEFIDKFTPEEMVGILTAAKQSVAVEAWLFRFNSVTPDVDGTSIDLSDERTIAGLFALEQANILSPGRANEILGTVAPESLGDFSVGDLVRVLPPFNVYFPDQYPITGFSNGAILILGDRGFAVEYVEKV